jgi:hypothetical protein
MSVPLSVLIVEDVADDAELEARELRRAGFEIDSRRAETIAEDGPAAGGAGGGAPAGAKPPAPEDDAR